MTIFPATSTQIPPQLSDLPSEVTTDIVKRVHQSIVEETATSNPYVPQREVAQMAERAAARGLAKLNFVNHYLREVTEQVMKELPDVAMAATRMAINNMTGDNQFRQKFVRLVQSHKHIDVPLTRLSLNEQKIVLEELSRGEVSQHLEKVKLNLRNVELDASQNLKNQGTSAKVSRASWIPTWMLTWMRRVNVQNQTDAETRQESLFQKFLTATYAMSRHGNERLDIDLDLASTTMSEQGVTALAEMLQQCKVSSLDLGFNDIGDKGASAIAGALPHSKLASLDLSYNNVGDAGASAIANALPQSKLTSMKLWRNRIKDEGASAIARALPHSELTSLNLRSNNVGDAGVSAIAGALNHFKLIAGALNHSKLSSLDLSLNNCGNAGAIAIANALPHSELISLDLCYNKIRDEGAIAIARALPHSKLTSLDLSSNEIVYARTINIIKAFSQEGPNQPTVHT